MNRRELLRLSLTAAPLLWLRCAQSAEIAEETRLHARPDLFDAARAQNATTEPHALHLSHDRDGYYYAPRSAAAPAPLLLFLHGATGSGARVMEHLGDSADGSGVIVLAPDSRLRTWGFDAGEEPQDLAFLDDALELVFTSYQIDPQRVAIGGFSDGASAALSWGLANGDLFSSIVAFSPGFLHLSSPPVGSPRVFISHGDHDSILPIDRCGRRIAKELGDAGYDVRFRVFDGDHDVPGDVAREGWEWAVGRGR